MKFVYKRNDPGHEGPPVVYAGGGLKRDHTFLFGCFLTFLRLSLALVSLVLAVSLSLRLSLFLSNTLIHLSVALFL